MKHFIVYSRRGCHLCDELIEALETLTAGHDADIEIRDVDADSLACARYGSRIPVLLLDGEVLCEGRLDHAAVNEALRATERHISAARRDSNV